MTEAPPALEDVVPAAADPQLETGGARAPDAAGADCPTSPVATPARRRRPSTDRRARRRREAVAGDRARRPPAMAAAPPAPTHGDAARRPRG